MKDKTINIILVLLIFVCFTSYFLIKDYIFKRESLMKTVGAIERYVGDDDWNKAEQEVERMRTIWRKQKPIVFMNYAEGDYSKFEESLNSVVGGVKAKDDVTVLANVTMMSDVWKNFNLVVPEP